MVTTRRQSAQFIKLRVVCSDGSKFITFANGEWDLQQLLKHIDGEYSRIFPSRPRISFRALSDALRFDIPEHYHNLCTVSEIFAPSDMIHVFQAVRADASAGYEVPAFPQLQTPPRGVSSSPAGVAAGKEHFSISNQNISGFSPSPRIGEKRHRHQISASSTPKHRNDIKHSNHINMAEDASTPLPEKKRSRTDDSMPPADTEPLRLTFHDDGDENHDTKRGHAGKQNGNLKNTPSHGHNDSTKGRENNDDRPEHVSSQEQPRGHHHNPLSVSDMTPVSSNTPQQDKSNTHKQDNNNNDNPNNNDNNSNTDNNTNMNDSKDNEDDEYSSSDEELFEDDGEEVDQREAPTKQDIQATIQEGMKSVGIKDEGYGEEDDDDDNHEEEEEEEEEEEDGDDDEIGEDSDDDDNDDNDDNDDESDSSEEEEEEEEESDDEGSKTNNHNDHNKTGTLKSHDQNSTHRTQHQQHQRQEKQHRSSNIQQNIRSSSLSSSRSTNSQTQKQKVQQNAFAALASPARTNRSRPPASKPQKPSQKQQPPPHKTFGYKGNKTIGGRAMKLLGEKSRRK